MSEQFTNVGNVLSLIQKLEPNELRDVFISMWRYSSGLNDGLTADDCLEIFSSVLKGSSDFSYELLKQICTDYGLDTVTDTFVLLPRKTYDNLFSTFLKGEIPEGIRLDTHALISLLKLENIADIEVSTRKGCNNATHFINSDMNFIYDFGIDDEEIKLEIEEFRQIYSDTWWRVDHINYIE